MADSILNSRFPQRLLKPCWLALLLATLTMIGVWAAARQMPYGETDGEHYLAMAAGQPEMKPFAVRFLAPAIVRISAQLTGSSIDHGFLVLGLLSEWTLLYGVLWLVLRRPAGIWFALILILLPFWQGNLINYQLPDLPHAAFCMIYLLLLRRRWWGWAAAMLAMMYFTRESTLLVAVIAAPVLWHLAGRRAGLLQLAGLAAGVLGSRAASRNALPNHQNMSDTLYLLGKVPWNLSRNIFGFNLWSNTMHTAPPIRVWNIPHWIPAGAVHQVGYTQYLFWYQAFTFGSILSAFGIGLCVVLCLVTMRPLHALLPRNKPWLWVAALYGAAAFLLAPVLGTAEIRLLDYGWPLFLICLPAVLAKVLQGAPQTAICALIGLNLIDAWIPTAARSLAIPYTSELAILLCCNLLAAWLLMRYVLRPQAHRITV